MPILPPIPEKLMLEYNFRHSERGPTQDSKIPQRYRRKNSLFQKPKIEITEDPYQNILHDLGKLHRKYRKSLGAERKKRYQDSSDSNLGSGSEDEIIQKLEENPILRSHVEMVKKLKSKKEEREVLPKAPERYLPNSMFSQKSQFVVDFPVSKEEQAETEALERKYNELSMPDKVLNTDLFQGYLSSI
jgi:hypothetical protein